MLEALVSPRAAEQKPFSLFFVGLVYAAVSILLANFVFARDPILSKHIPLFIVAFTVIFSIPFVHSLIRLQEIRGVTIGRGKFLFREHYRALMAFMWLFLGFLVAFSILYITLPGNQGVKNFYTQVEQFCSINIPQGMKACFEEYGIDAENIPKITGRATAMGDFMAILMNNLNVMFFTLLFSLTFGAGAIFILAWNASVIATAIGMLVKGSFSDFYTSFFMYLTHGIPEIAAYFLIALAGGILSTAVIRKDFAHGKFRDVLTDFAMLTFISVLVLVAAAAIEVFVTPVIFG